MMLELQDLFKNRCLPTVTGHGTDSTYPVLQFFPPHRATSPNGIKPFSSRLPNGAPASNLPPSLARLVASLRSARRHVVFVRLKLRSGDGAGEIDAVQQRIDLGRPEKDPKPVKTQHAPPGCRPGRRNIRTTRSEACLARS